MGVRGNTDMSSGVCPYNIVGQVVVSLKLFDWADAGNTRAK